MASRRHRHARSLASFLGIAGGFTLIALAVLSVVPVALAWWQTWVGISIIAGLAFGGITLVALHFYRYPGSSGAPDGSGGPSRPFVP